MAIAAELLQSKAADIKVQTGLLAVVAARKEKVLGKLGSGLNLTENFVTELEVEGLRESLTSCKPSKLCVLLGWVNLGVVAVEPTVVSRVVPPLGVN